MIPPPQHTQLIISLEFVLTGIILLEVLHAHPKFV